MFGRRRDRHVINLMQSVYEQEQENISTEWRESMILPIDGLLGLQRDKADIL